MDTMMLIRKQRMERGFQAMREQNVDLWIAAGRDLMHKGEPMLNYLLTFEMGGPVAIILTRDGTSYAINSPMETEELESMGLFSKVIANVDGYAGIRDFVAEKVRELQPQTIALNYSEKDITSDGLSFTLYRILTEAFQQGGFDGTVCSSQSDEVSARQPEQGRS